MEARITLKLGEKEIELTIEELMELAKMFGNPIPVPYPYNPQPWYPASPYPWQPTIWSSDNTIGVWPPLHEWGHTTTAQDMEA